MEATLINLSLKKFTFSTLPLFLSLTASAALSSGRYGANQVFDAQRSPAFPTVNSSWALSSFALPINSVTTQSFTITPGQYIRFFKAGGTIADAATNQACNVGMQLVSPNGTVTTVASSGVIYGLNSEGFLHNSNTNRGTFVSNKTGFAIGGGKTYTPTDYSASCAEFDSYFASTVPLKNGESWDGTDKTAELPKNIVTQQFKTAQVYQNTFRNQVFNRIQEVRRAGALSHTKHQSQANIIFDDLNKIPELGSRVQSKINDYTTDAVQTGMSSIEKMFETKFNFWTDGSLVFSKTNKKSNSEISIESQGLTFGMDAFYRPEILAGIALGVGRSSIDLGNQSEIEDLVFALNTYGSYFLNNETYIDGNFGFLFLTSETDRFDATTSKVMNGDRTGLGAQVSFQGNHEITKNVFGKDIKFIPHAKFSLGHLRLADYAEEDASGVSYSAQNYTTSTLEPGVRAETNTMFGEKEFLLSSFLIYRRDLFTSTSGDFHFKTDTTNVTKVEKPTNDENSFEVGAAGSHRFKDVHTLTTEYGYAQSFNNDMHTHRINVKYNFKF